MRCSDCSTQMIRRPRWTLVDVSAKLPDAPWYWTCGCGKIVAPTPEDANKLEPHSLDAAYHALWIIENVSDDSDTRK